MLETLLPLSCIVFGVLFRKRVASTQTLNDLLVNYVIYLVMPAIILLRVPHFELSDIPWYLAILAWVQVLFAAALVLACAKLLSWSRELTGAMLMVAALGNTSFLGFPATEYFFGADALAQAIIYDQFGMFMALSLYGTLVLSVYGQTDKQQSLTNILFKIIKFPPFFTLMAAIFIIKPEHIAGFDIINTCLKLLAATLLPVVMFIIGLYLRFYIPKGDRQPLCIGLVIKMLLVPASSLVFAQYFVLSDVVYTVSIFEAAMPPMMTAGILAMQAGLKPQLSSAMISLGLLIALIYLPLLAFIIKL